MLLYPLLLTIVEDTMKVYLCGEKGCCPSVDVTDSGVTIGEDDNTCTLTHDQFNSLKQKIKAGEL